MTIADVIALALTRNVSEDHFKAADVVLAQSQYVDGYISGYSESSTFFTSYCKPVIAYGTVVDCWDRIATEISDRGIVDIITQGASRVDPLNKSQLKAEYTKKLNRLIKLMVTWAESESGVTIEDDTIDYDFVGFSGEERMGDL